MSSCCKICLSEMCNGGCCVVDYNTLQSISYGLKCRLAEIGNSYANRLKEGYSCSPSDFDFNAPSIYRTSLSETAKLIIEHKEIKALLYAIDNQVKNIYNSVEKCICDEALCKIKDTALGILGINCLDDCRLDIKVDSSSEEEWITANPYCVSREKWEEHLYRVCNDLQVEITVVKQRCDIVYNIVREYTNCNIEYDITSTNHDQDCQITYEILRTKTNCDISYDIYRNLRDCGITFKTISTAIDCGITFDIDRENNCPMIATISGGYSLCDTEQDQNEQLQNIIYTFTLNQ